MVSKLVQFNCPEELLKAFDTAWQELPTIENVRNRTDAILDLMSKFVQARNRAKEKAREG